MNRQYLHFLLQCTYSTFIACLHRTGLSTSLTRYTGVCVSSPSRVLIRNGVCGRVAVRFLLVFCVWHVRHLLTLQPHRIGVQFSGSCIGIQMLVEGTSVEAWVISGQPAQGTFVSTITMTNLSFLLWWSQLAMHDGLKWIELFSRSGLCSIDLCMVQRHVVYDAVRLRLLPQLIYMVGSLKSILGISYTRCGHFPRDGHHVHVHFPIFGFRLH
ncbi:hypothetical protein KC19_10G119700 [Ceratodon purpureus]|uniref:Uncharacterized protein n=1 Tax=Ceratodon purpureus TaxID=3225 RepID=A0A8T0GN16_CERPU|nr:hypothetical protein KC19_10G119700 [Ceratodon purpureus]